jgi:hypothetical protein
MAQPLRTVSQMLLDDYHIAIRPGRQGECPFCHGSHFSIRGDDTIGKCFSPACGRFLTPRHDHGDYAPGIAQVLQTVYQDWHQELLRLDNGQRNAYSYVRDKRHIHPTVIHEAMLGAVPRGYAIAPHFKDLLDKAQQDVAAAKGPHAKPGRPTKKEAQAQERLDTLEEHQAKLTTLAGYEGWLAFFYTDASHRPVAVKIRDPYSNPKMIKSFTPGFAGLFGRELFTPYISADAQEMNERLIVTEGEFNALQLQTLAVRLGALHGKPHVYFNACAVGGVDTADIKTIQRVSATPTVVYDNDEHHVGLKLVDRLQTLLRVEACTTPLRVGEHTSDLDSYILEFAGDADAALEALRTILDARRGYGRIHIQLDPHQTTPQINAIEDALREYLPVSDWLYQRSGILCIVRNNGAPLKGYDRPPEAPVISPAHSPHVRELVGRVAVYEKIDHRSGIFTPDSVPKDHIEMLMARPGWSFHRLTGVIEAPTLRPDGTLLCQPGYDQATGLYFAPGAIVFPTIPGTLLRDDALEALELLKSIFADFPFLAPCHRSAAIAYVLSLLGRHAIRGPVPLFGATAPVRGSGKSLLIDTGAMVATGRMTPRWAPTDDPEEDRKRLLAIALAGDQLFLIDNVAQPLGSPALDAALTAQLIEDRILGKSEKSMVPFTSVVCATGNNLQFKGDLARRVVPIALDPQMERPEERTGFEHPDLLTWIREQRPQLVMAGLTVLLAYVQAGRPRQSISEYGSFEAWSALVRSALVWVGEADPNEGRKDIEATSDTNYQDLASLLACWHACYPPNNLGKYESRTLSSVLQDISLKATPGPVISTQAQPWHDLRDALGALDPQYDGKGLNLKKTGKALRAWKDRIAGDFRLAHRGFDRTKTAQWCVEEISKSKQPHAGSAGNAGSQHPPPRKKRMFYLRVKLMILKIDEGEHSLHSLHSLHALHSTLRLVAPQRP